MFVPQLVHNEMYEIHNIKINSINIVKYRNINTKSVTIKLIKNEKEFFNCRIDESE